MKNPFEQIESIDFLDIGCSGSLDDKWSPLFSLLFYTGFDPNPDECERLNNQTHPYKAASYLPYAIAGEKGKQTMYKTKSIYCYSLLRPNEQWLDRFAFADLFKVVGTEFVDCTTLNNLVVEKELKADIIKIDTQGLELPILKSGNLLVKNTFCIETETAFVEDYFGETTYAQIDDFLRQQGFLALDINIHKVKRNNHLSLYGKHQPIWCQTIWLYDFVGNSNQRNISTEQALKYLKICQVLEFFDYGFELACHFYKLNILDKQIIDYLEKPENWLKETLSVSRIGNRFLGLLPEKIRRNLLNKFQSIADYSHTC